jgi:HEPN domain-containing protein
MIRPIPHPGMLIPPAGDYCSTRGEERGVRQEWFAGVNARCKGISSWLVNLQSDKMPDVDRKDLQLLARSRLAEAQILLLNGKYDGAYYLSGYAVECALKSCVARLTKRFEFPDKKFVIDSHTHNLDQLLSVSGLKQLHSTEVAANAEFADNWRIVREWSERDRYALGRSARDAQDLYSAITRRRNGILTWLKKHW